MAENGLKQLDVGRKAVEDQNTRAGGAGSIVFSVLPNARKNRDSSSFSLYPVILMLFSLQKSAGHRQAQAYAIKAHGLQMRACIPIYSRHPNPGRRGGDTHTSLHAAIHPSIHRLLSAIHQRVGVNRSQCDARSLCQSMSTARHIRARRRCG
jgi:hypothetical protein